LKDGKVLSKFWGDEDTGASDITIDLETDTGVNKAEFPDADSRKSKNLEGTSSVKITTRSDDDKANKSFTPYVSNKPKKKNKLQSPRGLESKCIQTRAKSGISKAYKS